MHFQAGERLVGPHAVPCSPIDLNLPSPSLPDERLSAHTSCLGGSCFKGSSKKYIYICWGFPTGHFLSSSFTSVRSTKKKKKTHLFHFRTGVCVVLFSSLFLVTPISAASPFFSYVNSGKRRTGGLEILPLPLKGSLPTLASTTENVFS